MNYVTYHEWCKHLRDATVVDESAGKLGRISAQSGIPVDRLQRWLAKELYLSHAEFISLHEVLAETHNLGSEENDAAKIEESRKSLDSLKPQQCGCQSCEDNDISFDQSD
jgi:hypothetical protein